MRAVLGIGNPGSRYAHTKHNIGFMVLDRLADRHHIVFSPSKHEYHFAKGEIAGTGFLLIKPTTYVNLSGIAAQAVIEQHGLKTEDFLVICDDLNLEDKQIKIKLAGGDGGHNGVSSIIYHLADDHFPRIRFGIGRNFAKGEMVDYVLKKYTDEELMALEPYIDFCADLTQEFISGGIRQMLDHYSKAKKI